MVKQAKSLFDRDSLLASLRSEIKAVGTQEQWCAQHDVSSPYVTDVFKKRKFPGKKILNILGFEKVVLYQKKSEN